MRPSQHHLRRNSLYQLKSYIKVTKSMRETPGAEQKLTLLLPSCAFALSAHKLNGKEMRFVLALITLASITGNASGSLDHLSTAEAAEQSLTSHPQDTLSHTAQTQHSMQDEPAPNTAKSSKLLSLRTEQQEAITSSTVIPPATSFLEPPGVSLMHTFMLEEVAPKKLLTTMQELIENGADVNKRQAPFNASVLHKAILRMDFEAQKTKPQLTPMADLIKLLVKHNATFADGDILELAHQQYEAGKLPKESELYRYFTKLPSKTLSDDVAISLAESMQTFQGTGGSAYLKLLKYSLLLEDAELLQCYISLQEDRDLNQGKHMHSFVQEARLISSHENTALANRAFQANHQIGLQSGENNNLFLLPSLIYTGYPSPLENLAYVQENLEQYAWNETLPKTYQNYLQLNSAIERERANQSPIESFIIKKQGKVPYDEKIDDLTAYGITRTLLQRDYTDLTPTQKEIAVTMLKLVDTTVLGFKKTEGLGCVYAARQILSVLVMQDNVDALREWLPASTEGYKINSCYRVPVEPNRYLTLTDLAKLFGANNALKFLQSRQVFSEYNDETLHDFAEKSRFFPWITAMTSKRMNLLQSIFYYFKTHILTAKTCNLMILLPLIQYFFGKIDFGFKKIELKLMRHFSSLAETIELSELPAQVTLQYNMLRIGITDDKVKDFQLTTTIIKLLLKKFITKSLAQFESSMYVIKDHNNTVTLHFDTFEIRLAATYHSLKSLLRRQPVEIACPDLNMLDIMTLFKPILLAKHRQQYDEDKIIEAATVDILPSLLEEAIEEAIKEKCELKHQEIEDERQKQLHQQELARKEEMRLAAEQKQQEREENERKRLEEIKQEKEKKKQEKQLKKQKHDQSHSPISPEKKTHAKPELKKPTPKSPTTPPSPLTRPMATGVSGNTAPLKKSNIIDLPNRQSLDTIKTTYDVFIFHLCSLAHYIAEFESKQQDNTDYARRIGLAIQVHLVQICIGFAELNHTHSQQIDKQSYREARTALAHALHLPSAAELVYAAKALQRQLLIVLSSLRSSLQGHRPQRHSTVHATEITFIREQTHSLSHLSIFQQIPDNNEKFLALFASYSELLTAIADELNKKQLQKDHHYYELQQLRFDCIAAIACHLGEYFTVDRKATLARHPYARFWQRCHNIRNHLMHQQQALSITTYQELEALVAVFRNAQAKTNPDSHQGNGQKSGARMTP